MHAFAAIDIPFEAVYEVTIDGKPKMETRISLTEADGLWLMESSSRGTRGMARILKINSTESSSGHWADGRFRPAGFSHHSRVAGRDDRWTASFDWPAQQVTTSHEDGETVLALHDVAYDPASLTLALRMQLESGVKNINIDVVDETEIDHHQYQAGDSADIQTPLGCFEVIPLQRIRKNSQRYSTAWYAKTVSFIPVKIQHGKKDGKEFELRIKSLTLDGKEISAPTRCPS